MKLRTLLHMSADLQTEKCVCHENLVPMVSRKFVKKLKVRNESRCSTGRQILKDFYFGVGIPVAVRKRVVLGGGGYYPRVKVCGKTRSFDFVRFNKRI